MTDDGRELNWDDLAGKNIKFRWKVPIQIFRRNGSYFPQDDGEVDAMLDVGYFVGIYRNEQTQRHMIEMIEGEDFEGDSRMPLYTYNNTDIDMDYIRKQYFQQQTDSNGWFGGVLDGNVADIAKKAADVLGAPVEKVKTAAKWFGLGLIGLACGGAYLYYKVHQTSLTVNLNQNSDASLNGIQGYKEDERTARAKLKAALKENCKTNNFTTKSAISSAKMKYEKIQTEQAALTAKSKTDVIIAKIIERGICK